MNKPLSQDQILPDKMYRLFNQGSHKWDIIKAEGIHNVFFISISRHNLSPTNWTSAWNFNGTEDELASRLQFYTSKDKTDAVALKDIKRGSIYYVEFKDRRDYKGTVRVSTIDIMPVLTYRNRIGLDSWSEPDTTDLRTARIFSIKTANNFIALKNNYSNANIYNIAINTTWRRRKHALAGRAAAEAEVNMMGGKRRRKTRKTRR